jgi:hypothetical protein
MVRRAAIEMSTRLHTAQEDDLYDEIGMRHGRCTWPC